jgi:hypothetical protein
MLQHSICVIGLKQQREVVARSTRSAYSFYLFVSYLPFTSNQSVICDREIVALARQVANEAVLILVGSEIFCMGCIFIFWI